MVTAQDLLSELKFSTARSSGPGGQHVNKTNTKVVVHFNVLHSVVLTDSQKLLLQEKWKTKLTKQGELVVTSQDHRTQLQNKEAVLVKLDHLLKKAFERKKVRKATKPSKTVRLKRLENKKRAGEKKKWRQRPE
jgi:ribosome-associated protein